MRESSGLRVLQSCQDGFKNNYTFSSDPQMENEKICTDKNKEPEKFAGRNQHVLSEDASGHSDLRYLLWNFLHHISSGNQKVS